VAGKVGQGRDGWRCRAGRRCRVVHAFTKGGVGQGGGQGKEGMGGGRATGGGGRLQQGQRPRYCVVVY
jgi:hypothetical protein